MTHICCVIPPSQFLLDERVFPSLGVLKVAASLEQAGYSVDVLDFSGVANPADAVRTYASTNPGTTYAITATSPQIPAATAISSTLREADPTAKQIIGGPHPTLVLAAVKQEKKRGVEDRAHAAFHALSSTFDVIVAGDGEQAIFQAASRAFPKGTIDADDPKSPLWLSSTAFDQSPWPARHLIDLSTYKYFVDGERALSVVSQLGCPFRCTFCAGRNSPMLRRIRTRPAASVISEVMSLYDQYGTRGYMWLDDEINVNNTAMLDLMRGLKTEAAHRGIEWRLRGFLKSELFTDEQAEAMQVAGFRQLLIGFEAAEERVLVNIQKNATVADNTAAMATARKHGLKVKALMSIGHAGETEKSVMAVRDWLLEVKPADFDVTVITPYPGSPYYDDAVPMGDGTYCYASPKTGDRLYMEDVDFTRDAQFYKGGPGAYRSYVWTDALSREDIIRLRDYVEEDVRRKLGIPFYPTGSSVRFEASMGQLPGHILKRG